MESPTPAAPAQPAEPQAPPLTAAEAAVVADDFKAFDKADTAARAGKPLPAPEAKPVEAPAPDAAVPEPPKLSKRQQDTNDRIREATERATADLRAENERLRVAAAPPVAKPVPAPALALSPDPNDPEPDPSDLTKYPAGEYDPKFIRELGAHAARQELRKHDHATQQRDQFQAEDERVRTSAKSVSDAFDARTKADPDFQSRLDASLLKELIPASVVPKDLPIGPANIIAEALLRHPVTAPDVTEYFSTHRDEYARLTARDPRTGVPVHSQADLLREIGRIEGRLERATSDPPPAPKSVTDAPSPPVLLGSRSSATVDPVEAAVKADDFATFNRLELERQAGSRLRR